MTKTDELKDLVLKKRKEGTVVWLQHDGDGFAVMSEPIEEFIQQPADGILYDLNRLEEIALTYMEDRKWVNDFAVALTIRALHKERDALLAVVPGLKKLAEIDPKDGALTNVLLFNDQARVPKQIIFGLLDTLAALPQHLRGESDE